MTMVQWYNITTLWWVVELTSYVCGGWCCWWEGLTLLVSFPSVSLLFLSSTCAGLGAFYAPGRSDRCLRWAFFLVPGTKAPSCVQQGLVSGCGSEQADQGPCCGHVLLWIWLCPGSCTWIKHTVLISICILYVIFYALLLFAYACLSVLFYTEEIKNQSI